MRARNGLRARVPWKSLGLGIAAAGGLLLALGCPPGEQPTRLDQLASRPDVEGFLNRELGPERLVSIQAGNLTDAPGSTPEDRQAALESFLGDFGEFFGAGTAKAGAMEFVASAPELAATFGAAEQHDTVLLHQEHQGAIVYDALMIGDFVRTATGAGQLRRVQGRLFDPAGLPQPPDPTRETLDTARQQFGSFLEDRAVGDGSVSVLDVPVILGEEDKAGFYCVFTESQSRMDADSPPGRLGALVDPATESIHIIYDIPACRAGHGLGG